MVTARQNSAALRGTRSTAPIRSIQAPTTTPRPPVSTYTPWTGGGDSRFITAPGDSTIEYGVGRTTTPRPNPAPAPAPAPEPIRAPQPLDYRDSSYNSQIAAIERALRDFETGAATRGQRYEQDFTTGLQRLGFNPAPQAMAARGADGVSVGPLQGSFDLEGELDRTSAAARGTRGMRDEFAGRGMLRSSDFAGGFGDFQNRLQQQLTGMETGRTRFGEDLATELSQFQTRAQEQRAAAQAEAQNRALMRSLSQMGF
jgi:hypothetical protein